MPGNSSKSLSGLHQGLGRVAKLVPEGSSGYSVATTADDDGTVIRSQVPPAVADVIEVRGSNDSGTSRLRIIYEAKNYVI